MTAIRLFALPVAASLAMTAGACNQQPAAPAAPAAAPETRTIVETREVATPPVVIERQVQSPPIVIERDRARDGDSTTVRAGRDGIEVESTNR